MDPVGIIAAAGITWLTFKVLEGGFAIKPGQVETNISGRAIGLAILSIAAAILITRQVSAGLALVIGIAIHEFGHVAAYRAMGHDDARFRLIPFLGGVAISNKLPKDQLTDFYVAIMGPGIMLAPLVISGVAAEMLATTAPRVAALAQIMFIITGVINFFNLLPLWPLDGGRILRTITFTWSPVASRFITLGMSVALAVWAIYAKLPLIALVAFFGFRSARRIATINRAQAPMLPREAVMAGIAYLAALAAHGLAGMSLIVHILSR